MNRIILLAVKQQGGEYRGTVETNDRHWLHYFNKSEEKYADHSLVGYSYTEIKARLGSADEVTAGKARGDIVVSVDARLGRQSSGLKRQARHIEKVRETSPDLTADEVRISTEDIRDEDWLKVAKSLFSSVSPHIGYGRPHTRAKPTTLSLRCPRTSVPAQRSPREVCATARTRSKIC